MCSPSGWPAPFRTGTAQPGPKAGDRLFSSSRVQSLQALPNRPWSLPPLGTHSPASPKPLTEIRLARHLGAFGIHPKLFRIGQRRGKGYALADFSPVFATLLGPGSA